MLRSTAIKTIRSLLLGMTACALTLAPAWAQHRVSGVVTNDSGSPLLGAQIVESENPSNGTITDSEGRFSITTSGPNSTLSISYVGYSTRDVALRGQTQVNVQLAEDALQLDELVVVGYGTQRRRDLTGAVARADLDALRDTPSVNLAQLLKGTIPGLNIGVSTNAGSSPSMSVRGTNSLTNTPGPLIVLDGIIYRGDLVDINPADIGSIDVLKDASSAAIYGSQATEGVILITTKTQNQISKPVIEYSGQISLQSTINPDMRFLDREGYLKMVDDSYLDLSRTTESHWLQANPNYVRPTFIEPEANDGVVAGTDTDWYGLTTIDVPYIQNHNVSIRGRTENVNYYLSFGLTDQKNLIRHDDYKRYSFRVNLETNITRWLKIGTQSFFSLSDTSNETASFDDIGRIQPLIAAYNEDGSLVEKPSRGLTNFLLLSDNPDLNQRYQLNGTFYGEIAVPFIQGLSYRVNYSTAMTFNKQFNFNPYANNNYGSGYKNNTFRNDWTLDNIVTYKRVFGAHDINATLVYGVEYRDNEYTNASAQNFSDLTLGYNNLGMGQADLFTVASGAWKETSLYQMARLVYNYRSKYSLTATVRRDGFSGFSPTKQFGVFPSIGAAWRISEEDFFRNNVNWVDNLKLRASYGENGTRSTGRYGTMAKMATGNGYLFGDGGSAEKYQNVNSMANYALTWETTTAFNLGLDFSLLRGRVYGSYEFYNSRTTDQILSEYVSGIHGLGGSYSVLINTGRVDNTGHEFSLGATAMRKRDFTWDINFVFSRNRSKLVSYGGADADGDGREDDNTASGWFIGKPLNAIFGYRIIGMWQVADREAGTIPNGYYMGTYKTEDKTGDGFTTDDRSILGYRDPSYRFSIQNKFEYRNWQLNIFINSIQGGKNFYLGQPLSTFTEGKQWNFFEFDYWTPENPNAKYRQVGAWGPEGSSYSPYVSRSFIRLPLSLILERVSLPSAAVCTIRRLLRFSLMASTTSFAPSAPLTKVYAAVIYLVTSFRLKSIHGVSQQAFMGTPL